MTRPNENEYAPYFKKYIDLVGEDSFKSLWTNNTEETIAFFNAIPEDKHDYRYAENKWSIKSVLMHIIDTERTFAYRALVCGRGDTSVTLPLMDENLYAANVNVDNYTMAILIEEFKAVRQSSTYLYNSITEEQSKIIVHSSAAPFSARAIAYMMIGHIKHHMNIIEERYL